MSNPLHAGDLPVAGGVALPPGNEPDPRGAVTLEPPGGGTPRQRWEAAVAARPLEAPRPLPSALHSMAAAISGRSRPPLFTTGPNTRSALAAAGALGATTGTVVHLPAAPGPVMSAVLAHELTHTRSPVRRPRFFLGGASSLLDDDERQALAAGRDALSAGREAVSSAAGIVESLPVGGGLGAVGDMATRAARAAVLEATAGPAGQLLSGMSGMPGSAGEAFDAAGGALRAAGSDLVGAATSTAGGVVDAVGAAGAGAANTAAKAISGIAGVVGDATKAVIDPDQVVAIVEERLLREIERRGGRWQGVF